MPSSPVSMPIAKNKSNNGVPKIEDNFDAKMAKVKSKPAMKKI